MPEFKKFEEIPEDFETDSRLVNKIKLVADFIDNNFNPTENSKRFTIGEDFAFFDFWTTKKLHVRITLTAHSKKVIEN